MQIEVTQKQEWMLQPLRRSSRMVGVVDTGIPRCVAKNGRKSKSLIQEMVLAVWLIVKGFNLKAIAALPAKMAID